MPAPLSLAEYQALLRQDFSSFLQRCFHELNPDARFLENWHIEVMAARLAEAPKPNERLQRTMRTVPPWE